ncbi:MAG TPA: PleD family two-component system response regulator [Acetobacteraceae bacterium]|nr:PleD family two-component system response regulator [Acetobacteraceae bacterium]
MTARILIVDDVAMNIRLMEARLAAEYYQITAAADGWRALELARIWQLDLIMLDVMMPGMDGFEVCRKLKADPRTLHIPVIMVTALGEVSDRLRGLEAGADDFLTKPVDSDTLLARARSLMRLKRLLDEWRLRGETARVLGLDAGGIEPAVSGSRALIVDDWDPSARGMQDALLREGVLPARARSAVEVTALTTAVRFDLILLSLSLVGDDPLQLASELHAADATHTIPLLLVAEPDEHARLLRAFDLGATDWLIRPIDENELRVRARNQIRRKLYQDRLREDFGNVLQMAVTDPLTGLYNQRYIHRHLSGLVAAATPGALAVLMVDVDHFKSVNDHWGHAAGDATLRTIASTLRANTRIFDSVGRYGGEEFVVIMPGIGREAGLRAAERLREAIAALIPGTRDQATEPSVPQPVTASIGVSFSFEGASPEQLLQAADRALYAAKRAGRNRVEAAEEA